MNLKPHELALLATGTLPPNVILRAADELAKLLPNVGRAASTILDSYNARQHGCYEPDYASHEHCRAALQKLHGRVAGLLTVREDTVDLAAIDKQFADPTSIKDLLAAPLARNEVTTRIERLCKIYDNPKRNEDRPAVEIYARQLVADVARLSSLPLPEATDRIQEVLSGATSVILFQPTKIVAPAAGASPNQPLFATVTGRDFGRSNEWARRTGNSVSKAIRTATSQLTAQKTNTEPPAGSLRSQLARVPPPERPVLIARAGTTTANPALRFGGF